MTCQIKMTCHMILSTNVIWCKQLLVVSMAKQGTCVNRLESKQTTICYCKHRPKICQANWFCLVTTGKYLYIVQLYKQCCYQASDQMCVSAFKLYFDYRINLIFIKGKITETVMYISVYIALDRWMEYLLKLGYIVFVDRDRVEWFAALLIQQCLIPLRAFLVQHTDQIGYQYFKWHHSVK